VRVAGADHDRADADVAEVDLRAFVAGFEIAAAGKDGRGIIEAGPGGRAMEKEKWPQREGTR